MLEVRKNTFARSYENVFFREFARELSSKFEEKGFKGLLLGSPYCEADERLQIDALLITTHVICIIDFKNFSGKVNLPDSENFEQGIWTNEKGDLIKGGSAINPFVQLAIQKRRFEKVVKKVVKPFIPSTDELNVYHTEKIVCFQNNVELHGVVPPKYTNFHITDKAHYVETILDIIDVSNQTRLSNAAFEAFNEAFLAAPYKFDEAVQNELKIEEYQSASRHFDKGVLYDDQKAALEGIHSFLKDDEQQVFVLQGTVNSGKSYLVPHIQELAYRNGFKEVEVFASSARVAHNLLSSVCVENINSIYSYIYGGNIQSEGKDEEENTSMESSLEIVPLKASDNDEHTLFIVDEAQLISDSYYQSFDLIFGTGHLLKDFLTFADLKKSKRKVIFIGDPYQLQLGNTDESPLNPKYLEEQYELSVATMHLLDKETYSYITHEAHKCVKGMRSKKYNMLSFAFNEQFSKLEKSKIEKSLSQMLHNENNGHVLTYTNEDAHRVNLWIKKRILQTGSDISHNDLVVFHNNITLKNASDPFSKPHKVFNGEFATVERVGGNISETVTPKGKKPVTLYFREMTLKLKKNGETVEILSLENFRTNPKAKLSDDELVAYKVLLNMEIQNEQKKYPFEKSSEYSKVIASEEYTQLEEEIALLKHRLENGERVKGILEEKERAQRKLVNVAKRMYRKRIALKLNTDSSSKYFLYKNAVLLRYGWAMTVHRSMSYQFDHLMFNMDQGEDRGKNNDAYFRWVYTALSRAKEKVQLINYKPITPFDKIYFKEGNINTKSKETWFHSVLEDHEERLKNLEVFMRHKIESLGLKIDKIESYNWQERYYLLGKGDERLVLNILYDSKGNFKLPKIMQSEPQELGEKVIAELKQKIPLKTFDFIEDEWRRTSYALLENYLNTTSLKIESIIPNKYHDILKLYTHNDELEINIWYGDDGMFSKVIPSYYSEIGIWEEFKKIIENIRAREEHADK